MVEQSGDFKLPYKWRLAISRAKKRREYYKNNSDIKNNIPEAKTLASRTINNLSDEVEEFTDDLRNVSRSIRKGEKAQITQSVKNLAWDSKGLLATTLLLGTGQGRHILKKAIKGAGEGISDLTTKPLGNFTKKIKTKVNKDIEDTVDAFIPTFLRKKNKTNIPIKVEINDTPKKPEGLKQVLIENKAQGKKRLEELKERKPEILEPETPIPEVKGVKGFVQKEIAKGKRREERLKNWLTYKTQEGVAGRKKNLGFNKYSSRFWIKFNSRKATNIEFSSNRKPMSEATKRKISKSVARSKGSTAGYDTNKVNVSVNNSQGNFIDNGIDSIGKLTKAISPILKYVNEKEKISERKKRRRLQTVNTAVSTVTRGSRVVGVISNRQLAKQRIASREALLDKTLKTRASLEDKKLQTRINIEGMRVPYRSKTARAYTNQSKVSAARTLLGAKVPLRQSEVDALRKVIGLP
jgi:hypothetical protein